MKSIEIPAVHIGQLTLPAIAQELKSQGRPTCIDVVNWAKYGYKPMVNLYLGHSSSRLWCLFNVCEQHVLARNTVTNSNVWEDSCVEIFIADQDGRHYYNFEINCIGTALAARRCSQDVFQLLTPSQVQSIVRLGSLPPSPSTSMGRRCRGNWPWGCHSHYWGSTLCRQCCGATSTSAATTLCSPTT